MSETLTIVRIESLPSSPGKKDKWIAFDADNNKFSIWDKTLAEDLIKVLPITAECKITRSEKYGLSIQEAFPVGKGSPKPQNSPTIALSNKDNDIRASVALKGAIELICAGKNNDVPLKELVENIYNLLKEVAK